MQFHHIINAKKPSTLAVENPTKDQLNHLLQPKNTKYLLLNVGYAMLHPKDRYVRNAVIQTQTFKIRNVHYHENTVEFTLLPLDPTFKIKSLTFRTFSSNNKVYFIKGQI